MFVRRLGKACEPLGHGFHRPVGQRKRGDAFEIDRFPEGAGDDVGDALELVAREAEFRRLIEGELLQHGVAIFELGIAQVRLELVVGVFRDGAFLEAACEIPRLAQRLERVVGHERGFCDERFVGAQI